MTYTFSDFRTQLDAIGMTQAEFAELTDCSAHRITKWKRAKRGVPGWARSWLIMWKASPRFIREQVRGPAPLKYLP